MKLFNLSVNNRVTLTNKLSAYVLYSPHMNRSSNTVKQKYNSYSNNTHKLSK